MNSVRVNQGIVSFIVGAVFAVGLAISGMTQPQKIIGFLNPFEWDPSLLYVMVGAIGVHAVLYPLVRKRASPLLDTKWHVPTRRDITARLIIGSGLFGIGWGLGGYCPGPVLTSIATLDGRVVLFVGAMLAGMILFKITQPFLKLKE